MSEITGRITHMCMNIAGCLRNNARRKITFIENDDGTPLSDCEARLHLQSLLAKGHKLMCCSADCDNFDPFEKGCMGHDAAEWNEKMRLKKVVELEKQLEALKSPQP